MRALLTEGIAESTRAKCLAALDSDVLRSVARFAGDTSGLVEQVRQAGPLPPAWQEMTRRVEAEGLPDAPLHVARFLLLSRIVDFSLDRMAVLPVPDDVRYFLYDDFSFIANPDANSLFCFMPGSYHLATLCREVCLERFPVGQLHAEETGFPRSWLLRVPRREALSLAWHVFVRMGGHRPYYMPHNAHRRKYSVMFVEKEQRRSMVRIAQLMELNPQIHGFMGDGWLHSPNLGEASPHLKWMMDINRELVALGAYFTTLGLSPEDAGYLVGDKKRIALYESGQWKPLIGLLLAPRKTMIEWARQQVADATLKL